MTLEEQIALIHEWGKEKGIHEHGTPMTQAIKTLEETHELVKYTDFKNEFECKDAVGDIIVTLINYCAIQGYDIQDCLKGAYEEIVDRKGSIVNGTFVKEGSKL